MKVLLDTQTWLWSLNEPQKLNANAQALLKDPGNELWLSAASSWEIAVKVSIGKYTLPGPAHVCIPQWLSQQGITLLPISLEHSLGVATLPFHHKDPFDRLIVAVAQAEQLPLMTADTEIRKYQVQVIWSGL